jgi:hypothetical protein
MAEIQDLNVIDDSNIGRWPENMHFAAVNNAGRADEGLLARWYKDMDSSIVASGSSNAFTITSNRTIAALFNNLVIAFTANHTITGAATFNLNGLGAKNVKRYNGDDLAAGDIISGQPVLVIYKSSGDQFFMVSAPAALTGNTFADFSENASPGTPAADTARQYAADEAGVTNLAFRDSAGNVTGLRNATQAEMETGTQVLRTVTPGRQHFHPGHPKAWGAVDVTGALGVSYNATSASKISTGVYRVTLTNAMASTSYVHIVCPTGSLSFSRTAEMSQIVSASVFEVATFSPSSPAAADSPFNFVVFGDMP